jgi:hypothetical protein
MKVTNLVVDICPIDDQVLADSEGKPDWVPELFQKGSEQVSELDCIFYSLLAFGDCVR